MMARARSGVLPGGWRLALGACAGAALLAACHRSEPPTGATQAGLVVQTGRDGAAKLLPDRLLGCYVGGRLIGQKTLADCARRNGVASGALDVGLANAQAALPAATGDSAESTPPTEPSPQETAAAGLADCAQFDDGAWATVAEGTTLAACVRVLFDGHCLADGVVSRGRWADRLLRLSGGRIEASVRGAPWRLVAVQADGCAVSNPDGTEG